MTSVKPGRRIYPVEALLKAEETGLAKDSIAMAHQILAVSKNGWVRFAEGSIQTK